MFDELEKRRGFQVKRITVWSLQAMMIIGVLVGVLVSSVVMLEHTPLVS